MDKDFQAQSRASDCYWPAHLMLHHPPTILSAHLPTSPTYHPQCPLLLLALLSQMYCNLQHRAHAAFPKPAPLGHQEPGRNISPSARSSPPPQDCQQDGRASWVSLSVNLVWPSSLQPRREASLHSPMPLRLSWPHLCFCGTRDPLCHRCPCQARG